MRAEDMRRHYAAPRASLSDFRSIELCLLPAFLISTLLGGGGAREMKRIALNFSSSCLYLRSAGTRGKCFHACFMPCQSSNPGPRVCWTSILPTGLNSQLLFYVIKKALFSEVSFSHKVNFFPGGQVGAI